MRRIAIRTSVVVTEEQFKAAAALAKDLGFSGRNDEERIKAMMRDRAEDAVYYAEEKLDS